MRDFIRMIDGDKPTSGQVGLTEKRKTYEDVEALRRRIARMVGRRQLSATTFIDVVLCLDRIVRLVADDGVNPNGEKVSTANRNAVETTTLR